MATEKKTTSTPKTPAAKPAVSKADFDKVKAEVNELRSKLTELVSCIDAYGFSSALLREVGALKRELQGKPPKATPDTLDSNDDA